MRKRLEVLVKDAFRFLGIEVGRHSPRGEERLPKYVDREFERLYREYAEYTMVPWQGLHAAFRAVRYIVANDIAGSIVECGVWRGGCSAIMAETLSLLGRKDRKFLLYDTFAGMPEPEQADWNDSRSFHAAERYADRKRNDHSDWCYAPRSDVERLLESLEYPVDRFRLIVGKVEDTIPRVIPDRIALLRLDTDFYSSTLHELEHLYPRLSAGGVLIIDDYGAWAGARKAVDEYFADRERGIFLMSDHGAGGAVVGVKS